MTTTDPTAIDIRFDPRQKRMSGVATHGMTRFDVPFISQITPDLYQGGCEEGLALPSEIKHVVSLYPWERYETHGGVMSEMYVTMYDSTGQEFDQVDQIAAWIVSCMQSGPVLVHCQAGLNRSSLVAARVLMAGGSTGAEAIDLIRAKRSPACLCNEAFEAHVRSFDVDSAGSSVSRGEGEKQ